jgi:molybdopterin/thiamine biosynthesis adenylyltransferase
MNIVIIGVGALGSHTALFMRNTGKLTVVDMDRVESKNILSQFHTSMGKGQNKARAFQKALQGLFGIKVDTNTNRLTKDNVRAILWPAALVIDCTDNIEARLVIRDFVRVNNTPCLHGALSEDGTFARIVWDEDFVADAEGTPGQATCEDGVNLPFHGVAGAYIALVAQQFLTTGKKVSLQIMPNAVIRLA